MAKYKTEIHYILKNNDRLKLNSLIKSINSINNKLNNYYSGNDYQKMYEDKHLIQSMRTKLKMVQEMVEYLEIKNQLENNKIKIK